MRIVFYGTPNFAVASLSKMHASGFTPVAVVTSPDKPAGRGMKLHTSAVKDWAIQENIPLLQPENLKSEAFQKQLSNLNPDLQIVIAFRMMPESVWNFPPLGTLNLHASLLPDYRGAAPINHAIMNGETKTGVTTFFLKHEIDTGDILLQREIEIYPEDDAGSLHDRLMEAGAELVVESLIKIKSGRYETHEQIMDAHAKKASKIFKETCEIDWSQSVAKIHNQIRGLSPVPGAFTHFQNKTLKIYKGHWSPETGLKFGEFEIDRDKHFRISAADGWYYPEIVQPEGKRKMQVSDFVNGLKL